MLKNADYRRHVFVYRLLWYPLKWFLSIKFNYKAEYAPKINEPCIILSNHVTDYDMAFVPMSFKKHMYFVASEHILRWGWLSKLIMWLFAPIPRAKGTVDGAAAYTVLKLLRRGKNVCMFAEGNNTFNGITGPIHPTVGGLVKTSKAALITYRISGGYLSRPRWSEKPRRGYAFGKCVNIYSQETLSKMTPEEIGAAVSKDLYEDAFATQRKLMAEYKGKRIAEKLETCLYVCPKCHGIGTLHSCDDRFFCDCGLNVRYNEYGFFEGDNVPYETISDWDAWQDKYMAEYISSLGDKIAFSDEGQILNVINGASHKTERLCTGRLTLTRKGMTIDKYSFDWSDISSLAIVARANIVFTAGTVNYEIRSDIIRSSRKYFKAYELLSKNKN